MSAIYFAIPTHAGQAKIANAIALGVPLKITKMAVGDGNGQPVTPNPAQTALVREQRRAPLNTLFQDPLNPAQLVAEQIIPENVGGWWIREVGLYDETGTLIAIANSPDTYKPQLSEGSGRTQTIRIVLIVSDTSAVELKIDPAVVLATRKYVDDVMKAHKESRDHPDATKTEKGLLRLSTLAEALAGILDNVAVTPTCALEVAFSAYPVGAPIPWPLAAPPSGFLLMNGQSFNKTTYPKLALAYPSGTLPDLRGEFIRGWDNGRGVDTGRSLLAYQLDSFAAHAHQPQGVCVSSINEDGTDNHGVSATYAAYNSKKVGETTSVGGNETRPRNVAFNYIVKAA